MRIRITKNYPQKELFNDFELEVESGEIVCVLGASGVGKTTLLNAFARLTEFEGVLENIPEKVSYLFQTSRLLPHLTVEQNLWYVFEGKVEEEKIQTILEKCFLSECKNRKAKFLSGGEKKRVALARAFLSDAQLLLMDEPFCSVDTALKIRLISLFASLWQEQKKTVLFVTHDLEESLMVADRIVLLSNGGKKKEYVLTRTNFPSDYGEPCALRSEILSELLSEENTKEKGVKICEV